MIYSGMPNQSKTRAAHGVAVCLNRTATTAWKNAGAEWEPVSERILRIIIYCSPMDVTLIAVYAPVNPSSRSMADDSDSSMLPLRVTVDQIQKGDMLLMISEVNARLGDREHLTAPQCVGTFTTDVQNVNEVKLIDFCILNDLVVTNTFFQHKTIHQTSWHILEYTIVNRKFRSSVEDVRSLRRATGAIETDHHPLRSKVKLHLKCKKKKNQQQPQRKLDRSKLEDEVLVERFQSELEKNLAESKKDEDSIDVKYAKFVKHIKGTAEDHFQPNQG